MFRITGNTVPEVGAFRFSLAPERAQFTAETKGLALKYVSSGTEYYRIGEKRIAVSAGEFIVVPIGVNFKALTQAKPAAGVCVDLDFSTQEKLAAKDLSFLAFDTTVPFHALHTPDLQRQLHNLPEHTHSKKPEDLLLQLNSSFLNFYTSFRSNRERLNTQYKKDSTAGQLALQLLGAENYLKQNYTSKLTLNTLARQVGLSAYHLQRLFTLCLEQSPKQYQMKLRMEAAAANLPEDAQISLEQIAFNLGFPDLSSFSRAFKKHFGQSPRAFRKMCKN